MCHVRGGRPLAPRNGYRCLEAPILSIDHLAERPMQRCIVVGYDVPGLHRCCVRAGVPVSDEHRIESKITRGAARAVDAILSFHACNHYARSAVSAQIVRQVGLDKGVGPLFFKNHLCT